jgi:hypothetical protein
LDFVFLSLTKPPIFPKTSMRPTPARGRIRTQSGVGGLVWRVVTLFDIGNAHDALLGTLPLKTDAPWATPCRSNTRVIPTAVEVQWNGMRTGYGASLRPPHH